MTKTRRETRYFDLRCV